MRKFGVSEEKLRDLVSRVGNSVYAIAEELKKKAA
jgi:hypothetical protein